MIIPKNYLELKKGRVTLPKVFTDLIGVQGGDQIALCSYEEYGHVLIIKPLSQADNLKVVAIARLEEKRRFVFPKKLLSRERNEIFFEVYIFNGDLILEEVENV